MRIMFNLQRPVAFGSKTTLYTDFDGTYFPFKRDDVSIKNADKFSKMYLPFDTFKKSDDEFKVVVTTGRSANDFLHTQEIIQNAGLDYCLPDGLISANGANSFLINKNDGKIRLLDITKFDDALNIDTTEEIKSVINACAPDVFVTKCKINGKKETYGKYSSEYKLDMADEKDRLKYASIARDGKYNAEIVLSDAVDDDLIFENIKKFIDDNSLPFSVEHYKNSPFTDAVQYFKDGTKEYSGANVIFLKYAPGAKQPDKLDIIKREVEKISASNSDTEGDDLIIVSGDGFNDEGMLNPLNYIDTDDEELSEKTLQKLKKLPLRVIICGNDAKLDNLRKLGKALDDRGVHIIKCAPDTISDYPKAVEEFMKQ